MATTQQKNDAAAQPEGWRPSPGDVLTGKVSEVGKGWSDYTDSFYPIVTIETDDGKFVNVHCFHEILKQRMLDLRPTIGQEITITCGEKTKTKDGKRSFVTYKVTVPGEDGSGVWDSLGAQPQRASRAATDVPAPDDDDIPF